MKLVRTRKPSGEIVWVDEIASGAGILIEGDIFGSYRTTEEGVPIRERLAPFDPPAIIGIAKNYARHAMEFDAALPERPVFFMKLPGSVLGSGAAVQIPKSAGSTKLDYEAELAVVIGRSCRNVQPEEAWETIFGFTCANDISARDWQKEWGGGQFCRGKSFDTFCPVGPRLVTRDEFSPDHFFPIRGYLNDTLVQQSTTQDLIFSIPELISFLSQSTTLPAGTLILTGTPSGVGMARNPPRYLKEGDVFTVEIEGIGRLISPVKMEV